jgi:hypothetical protein
MIMQPDLIKPRELIQRAIRQAISRRANHWRPRWAVVRDLFACGSDMAERICYEYGFDPHKSCGEA